MLRDVVMSTLLERGGGTTSAHSFPLYEVQTISDVTFSGEGTPESKCMFLPQGPVCGQQGRSSPFQNNQGHKIQERFLFSIYLGEGSDVQDRALCVSFYSRFIWRSALGIHVTL